MSTTSKDTIQHIKLRKNLRLLQPDKQILSDQRPATMKLSIIEAKRLTIDALAALGYNAQDASTVAHHLIDSELRGYPSAGLARVLSIAEVLRTRGWPRSEIKVTKENLATAQIDGCDSLGYLVGHRATEMAIDKAKQTGIAVVGANNTWYTGMLSYYAEMVAKNDLVCIIASNCTPWVAPEGGYKPMFGTNPFCIGFPSSDSPIIWDIGTSKIIHADAKLAQRIGSDIPPDVAFDSAGNMTRSPAEALAGALAVWGGHKGTGLAIAVQLLGMLAGSSAMPPELKDFGFLIIAVDPAAFRSTEDFKNEVNEYSSKMRQSPSRSGQMPLRMPFDRSNEQRGKAVASGYIDIQKELVDQLQGLI